MIDADYDELRDEELQANDDLNLSEEDALPWLENDEADEDRGGVDIAQMIGFLVVLAALGFGVLGLIWYVTNKTGDAAIVADGSTIEAPEGPYKVRPDDPDAKEFPGTGDVAPAVGDGQSPDARLANNTGADAGDQDLGIAMPPLPGADGSVSSGSGDSGGATQNGSATGANRSSAAQSGSSTSASTSSTSATGTASGAASTSADSEPTGSGGMGVQLAAYGSRARAEQGWRQISSKTSALKGYKPDIRKGTAGIGTVYRVKVLTGTRAKATQLCRTLRSQGIDCAVKP
ncbi:MAG: SPOR domain-containing protein [Pseudomonadota bacterium]